MPLLPFQSGREARIQMIRHNSKYLTCLYHADTVNTNTSSPSCMCCIAVSCYTNPGFPILQRAYDMACLKFIELDKTTPVIQ